MTYYYTILKKNEQVRIFIFMNYLKKTLYFALYSNLKSRVIKFKMF